MCVALRERQQASEFSIAKNKTGPAFHTVFSRTADSFREYCGQDADSALVIPHYGKAASSDFEQVHGKILLRIAPHLARA
jgi:hypothetical protein